MSIADSPVSPAAPTTSVRVTVTSGLAYQDLVRFFEAELGQWDLGAARSRVASGWTALAERINEMRGPHGLMILSKTDQGEIASVAGRPIRCVLYEVGNPVVATDVLSVDVRACFLVPFRVALYDDGKGVGGQMVYDKPSSLLASLGRTELDDIGASLDEKMAAVTAALMKTTKAS